jgi:dTDP-4-dehydrorhamnose reductase
MKILLTGASGYLGQHFLNALIKRTTTNSNSYEIFATYGSMEGFKESVMTSTDVVENKDSIPIINVDKVDFTDKDAIHDYIESKGPFDVCFHIAAMSSPKQCQLHVEKAKVVNVPKHFFDELKDTPVVALSTDQVYCGTKAPYVENSAEPGPVNAYAQSKLDMESLLLENKDRVKPAVCLRSSIILGPLAPFGGAHSTFLHFCQSRKGTETTFFTDEIRSVIAVKDVVNILLHFCNCIEEGTEFETGVYNMGGPERASRMDMAIAVAKECAFSHDVFIPAEKAKQERGANDVPSPLDISMNSSKLEALVGCQFSRLENTVQQAFA